MLHQKIKRKRRENNYSQDHMANLLGISPSAYSKIERGETRIDIERLKQIAEALKVDVFDFLEDDAVIITHNSGHATGNNGIAIHPSYKSEVESQKQLIDHLKEVVATQRQEIDRLLRILEQFAAK